MTAAIGLGPVRRRHLVPPHGLDPSSAPLPRQGHHRARVARRPPAGVGRDDRPPGAARLPRPAVGAARPGVRARPHVHVAVLDVRMDPAPRRHRRAAGVDPPRAASCLPCSPCPTVLTSTWRPGRRARGPGARRARRAAGQAPLHHGDHRAARQGGARHRHRRPSLATRPASGVGALVRAGGGGPLGLGGVAHAGLGALRRRLRRRDRVRGHRSRRPARRRAARAGRRAPGCRPTSARPSARSASCVASGWTARGDWPGSRTTPPRSSSTPTSRCPTG